MRKPIFKKTAISCNEGYEGERLEVTIKRFVEGKEPITSISPTIYTLRKDGVLPEYDIRADKWAIAQEAMSKVQDKFMKQREQNVAKWNGGQETQGDA